MAEDFEERRRAFAAELRRTRERGGQLEGRSFAAALGWAPSKLSKIETGKQTITPGELEAWLAALGAPEAEADRLRSGLRDVRLRQVEWRRQLRSGHSTRQDADAAEENDARTITAVDTAAVPGLLQTPDYAHGIFASQATLLGVPATDLDAAVAARMQRQRILYEGGRTISILMSEAALLQAPCSPEVMAGQLDRLATALSLPGIRVGILPLRYGLPVVPWHGAWIVDDVVHIETLTAELRLDDPEQVATVRRWAEALWSVAAEGDEARAVLRRVLGAPR